MNFRKLEEHNNFIYKIIDKDIKKNNILKINTRFAPDPNSFIHLGHVKSILINFNIAKKYGGKFKLRFDDTNPSKDSIFYIKNIKKDILWLRKKWDGKENYTSNYFDKIFYFAIKLIKKELAYVDMSNFDIYKKNKGNFKLKGVNSIYRNNSIKNNINNFINMKKGFFKPYEACLRAKINMKSSNLIIRDPVLYRIRFINHFKTGKKWCIYPTYDFSHCISDFIENITYSLCTLEFENNRILYNWILDSLEIKNKPIQCEFSKLNINNFPLSKRNINFLIKNNIIDKLNDPRLLTISGLRNRGYTKDVILDFCNRLGLTKKNSLIDIKNLESIFKKKLDKISIRIMSIIDPLILCIENYICDYETINVPNNIKNINSGFKKIIFSKYLYIEKNDILKQDVGNVIKLRYSYIIRIKSFKKLNNNKIIVNCKYYNNTKNTIYFKNKKVLKIIHWVSLKKNFKSYYKIYYNLFKNFSNNLSIEDINKNSFILKKGFTEKSSKLILKHKYYQFERIGYFYAKSINYDTNKIIFNKIIDI